MESSACVRTIIFNEICTASLSSPLLKMGTNRYQIQFIHDLGFLRREPHTHVHSISSFCKMLQIGHLSYADLLRSALEIHRIFQEYFTPCNMHPWLFFNLFTNGPISVLSTSSRDTNLENKVCSSILLPRLWVTYTWQRRIVWLMVPLQYVQNQA